MVRFFVAHINEFRLTNNNLSNCLSPQKTNQTFYCAKISLKLADFYKLFTLFMESTVLFLSEKKTTKYLYIFSPVTIYCLGSMQTKMAKIYSQLLNFKQ